MNYALLILQLISGAFGGNVAGALFRKLSLGTFGNAIAGVVGGGIGGQLLELAFPTGSAGSTLDQAAIITQILGCGVSGGLLT
ncbi:hypothetical protein [Hyphomicrobium sp.]|uniref:hypothetical protein n=1 Tax=Hyphomicrobium sp. TaxID=82 RepID=UPI002D78846D|nr:hypothetical protein [Hyphomicrobium sp.]HET6389307.1 hypothetical protein [Hyphomicrobium sp.]